VPVPEYTPAHYGISSPTAVPPQSFQSQHPLQGAAGCGAGTDGMNSMMGVMSYGMGAMNLAADPNTGGTNFMNMSSSPAQTTQPSGCSNNYLPFWPPTGTATQASAPYFPSAIPNDGIFTQSPMSNGSTCPDIEESTRDGGNRSLSVSSKASNVKARQTDGRRDGSIQRPLRFGSTWILALAKLKRFLVWKKKYDSCAR
jgi:hypothetical protein